jgi:DNA-binding transcriptional ArsR family regulator
VDQLTATFSALSDPTRRAILARLRNGPASVAELAEPFEMSQQAISKHLSSLESAHLIRKRKAGRQSICELRPEPIRGVANWAEGYRRFWENAFGRLRNFLATQDTPSPRRPSTQAATQTSSKTAAKPRPKGRR